MNSGVANMTLTSGADVYVPVVARISSVNPVGPREKLFRVELPQGRALRHRPGQFVAVTLFGVGEAPISVCSAPPADGHFELCVRAAGNVTNALHALVPGSHIGIRGPFGNGFPMQDLLGRDVLLVVGGLGMAPLRSLLWHALASREQFARLVLLIGARTPEDLLFPAEIAEISKRQDIEVQTTVDAARTAWTGNVGPVTNLLRATQLDPDKTVAISVGPPAMYRFILKELADKEMPDERTYFSLERHMKCSIGKCGHCQMGPAFACQDGPVFRYSDIRHLPEAL